MKIDLIICCWVELTWFFFFRVWTLNKLFPYSCDVAKGIFSPIHSFSSSTSRRNWNTIYCNTYNTIEEHYMPSTRCEEIFVRIEKLCKKLLMHITLLRSENVGEGRRNVSVAPRPDSSSLKQHSQLTVHVHCHTEFIIFCGWVCFVCVYLSLHVFPYLFRNIVI